jgi:hypothetical protein
LLEKRRGTNASLYLAEGRGWQMKPAQTPIPDTGGGEGGHGTAKPNGVIHRYAVLPVKCENPDYRK